jgi:hypothetical protein
MKTGAEILQDLSAKHLIVLGTLHFQSGRPFSTKTLCRQVLKLHGKDGMQKTRTILARLEKLGLIMSETTRGPGIQVRDWKITSTGKMLVRGSEIDT